MSKVFDWLCCCCKNEENQTYEVNEQELQKMNPELVASEDEIQPVEATLVKSSVKNDVIKEDPITDLNYLSTVEEEQISFSNNSQVLEVQIDSTTQQLEQKTHIKSK